MTDTTKCDWCDALFQAVRFGEVITHFCRPECGILFAAASRRWMRHALDTGLLTTDALKAHERVAGDEGDAE